MSPIIQILTAELPGKTPIFCARMGTVFGGVNLAGLVLKSRTIRPFCSTSLGCFTRDRTKDYPTTNRSAARRRRFA